MAYSEFTDQIVFNDASVNVLCNRIMQSFTDAGFDLKNVVENFCLTGTVAKIIQGAALTNVPVIAFITDSEIYYKHCANSMPKAVGATAVRLKEVIQLKYKDVFLEVWKTNDIGTINTTTNIAVQDTADIPSNIN